jgi:hypothetical protein
MRSLLTQSKAEAGGGWRRAALEAIPRHLSIAITRAIKSNEGGMQYRQGEMFKGVQGGDVQGGDALSRGCTGHMGRVLLGGVIGRPQAQILKVRGSCRK